MTLWARLACWWFGCTPTGDAPTPAEYESAWLAWYREHDRLRELSKGVTLQAVADRLCNPGPMPMWCARCGRRL